MKKKISLTVLSLATLFIFSGCQEQASNSPQISPQTEEVAPTEISFLSGERSPITITGDVETEITLTDFSDYETTTVEKDGENFPAIPLINVLNEAVPLGSEIKVIFHSPDGVMAEISKDDIDESILLYWNETAGFSISAPNFPPQAGIRNIDYIVLVAEIMHPEQACLRTISGESGYEISYGNLFLEDSVIMSVVEGNAEKNGLGVSAYTRRPMVPISSYIDSNGGEALAYFGDGSEQMVSLDGYFDWRGNTADYVDADGKTRIHDIVGVWEDAPEASITDLKGIVENTEGDVLVIHIDGLGYKAYEMHGLELSKEHTVEKMRTVMPSISNVALAAMITGETPDINGVTERSERELLVPDMFENVDGVLVEGYSKLVNSSVSPILNADENADGSTDDEVFASAMKTIEEEHELVFVHFHGYDDISHTYGTYSDEAIKKLDEIEGYVNEMLSAFSGTTYIISDHGQHDTSIGEKLGDHGEFKYEDMCIPFFTIK